MRCTLVTLPFQDPSTPSFGVALLAASLARKGRPYSIVDANLDFLRYVESGRWGDARKEEAFEPAQARDGEHYLRGLRRQKAMLEQLGESFPEYAFSTYQLEFNGGWPDLHTVRRDALRADGLWSRWLADGSLIRAIMADAPAWIGLSVAFEGQLPAALALGHRLKCETAVEVVWGGGLLNTFADHLGEQTPIWDCADGVILGPGEGVVAGMVQTDKGIRPDGATRLANGAWLARTATLEPALRPEFGAFPLDQYRGAGRVLPYRAFARCTWNKCAFCADDRYHFHTDRLRGNATDIADELTGLATEHGADGFYFLDAELPSRFMIELARALHTRGSALRWGGNCRFSNRFQSAQTCRELHEGGCRFLRFGMESASPQVLKAMRKGITPEMSSRILHAMSQAGIGAHVYFMRNFPGETPEQLRLSEEFLLENSSAIDSFNFSEFVLYECSPLSRAHPEVEILRPATQASWHYPNFRDQKRHGQDMEALENLFYAKGKGTRCFPTTADSIILADKFLLFYNN